LGRPPVKSTKACAMAKRKGELEAETKFWDKQPLTKKLKRLLWKKLEEVDPVKIAALIGTTYLIHETLLTCDSVVNRISTVLKSPKAALTAAGWEYMLAPFSFAALPFLPLVSTMIGSSTLEQDITKTHTPEIIIWLLSFVIAFMLIEHGGEVMGMIIGGEKTLGTLALALLG